MQLVYMLEDDSDDRYLTSEMLNELGIDVEVSFFSSSTELFEHLSDEEKPALILVDYNASPENGPDVLKKIKNDPACNDIPVIILSDSDHPKFRKKCYALGASSYIRKPDKLSDTKQKIGTFFKYWFEVAEV
jgi:CheY-like chemotaxis protein